MDGFRVEQCSTKKTDAETSRVSYMDKITWAFPKEMDCVLPTAEEEKSFEEALAHLVRLFPNKRDKDRDTEGRKKLRNGLNACGRKAKMCRKGTLKEILNLLQFMERKRMYDPPADDEIRFFLLIKKFVRSMLVFFTAQGSSTGFISPRIHGVTSSFFRIMEDIEDSSLQRTLISKAITLKSRIHLWIHHRLTIALFKKQFSEIRSTLNPKPRAHNLLSEREQNRCWIRAGMSGTDIHGQYGCFTYSKTLRNVDELAELNRYLADFSAFVSELDIKDGSAMKPLMGIRENDEVAPNIRGSKQRSNMFYWHKFNLAFLDSCSSQDACFPPSSPEEQRSYRRVLDLISSPSFSARNKGEAMNIFSEELYARFLERIERETRDLERHCICTRMSILDKISISESWESMLESNNADTYNSDVDEEEKELVELKSRLVKNCQVSKEDLPDYIASVQRCHSIAHGVLLLLSPRECDCHLLWRPISEKWNKARIAFGWDALHALTLFKHGSFSPGNVFRENIILRNPKKNVSAELQHEEAKMKKRKRAAEEEEVQKENVKILEGIVEDLRRIGGSDTRVDEEESVLMYKIWMSVASSVHFFFCAIAYEQRNHIIARGGLSDVRKILGVKTRKMMRKNSTNATDFSDHCIKEKICDVINMTVGLWEDMHILVKILRVYEQGLREKLGHGLHEKQGTQPRSKPEF